MSLRGKIPTAIERQYISELKRILENTKRILERTVVNLLPGIFQEYNLQFKQDRAPEDLDRAFARALKDATDYLNEVSSRVASDVGNSVSNWNSKKITQELNKEISSKDLRREIYEALIEVTNKEAAGLTTAELTAAREKLKRLKKSEIRNILIRKYGVLQYSREPWLVEALQIFSQNNIGLIKSNNIQFLEQSRDLVLRSMQFGERHEEVARKLLSTQKRGLEEASPFRKAKTRAALIARDQVSKLNGNLTRLRQEKSQVRSYIWRTAGDGRVRYTHQLYSGKKFLWTEGAGSFGVHPGEEVCLLYTSPSPRD